MEKSFTHPSIFIHGILRRSGTNYLNKLVLTDLSCEQPLTRIRENWFLHHSNSLLRYSDDLLKIYSNPKWGGTDFPKDELLGGIGKSLVAFLQSHISSSDKRLVTKTPSVQNLKFLDQLFPNVKNIIIVRNPLDVAASAYNTWKVPVDKTISQWNEGCASIYEYEKQRSRNYLLIRYEDLISDLKKTFLPCIAFLDLNLEAFNWDKLENLPVYGSGDTEEKWKVVKKGRILSSIR